ncbi:MAG: T9SS type A sorting domain-containing protein [Bacteroidota bacterium]
MKGLFLILILSSLVVVPTLAQNPALYQQGNLTLTGEGILTVQGDWQNTAGATFANNGKVVVTGNLLQESDAPLFTTAGTVELAGSSGQTIDGTGSGSINLDSLIVNNPDTVKVTRDGVSVTAGLRFAQGILYLNQNRSLALGSSGELVNEQESSRATGPGSLTASADLNAPSVANPGKLGLLISSSQNLGSTTITRTHTLTGPQDNGIFRSFAVSPTNNQNLDASLRLNYFDAELNGLTESSLAPFTSEDGNSWQQQSATNQSEADNFVEYGGLASLNLTTLSEGQSLPVADAGSDTQVCAGESVQIGGSPSASNGTEPYIYAWSPTEGLDDATLANPTATPTATTTYTLLVTDANGNTAEDAVTITVNALPIVTFNPVDPVCAGSESFDLSGFVSPAGGTFSSTSVSGSSFDPTLAGVGTHTITYSYTDGNSCENTATVAIVVNALPAITFNPVGPYCPNDAAVDLSASVSPAGGSFFGPGINGSTFDPSVAGIGEHGILYAFTDGNGCSNRDTVTIIVGDDEAPVPDVDSLPELTVQVNEAITTIPTATDNCGNATIEGITTDPLSYDQPGSYTIIWVYTDAANNEATQTQTVIVASTDEVEPLNLTSECSDNPRVERRWRVTNPNDFEVPYTYKVVGTNQTDELIATPGLSYFTTQAVKGPNTTKIIWLDENGKKRTKVKASGGAACNPTLTFETSEGSCQFAPSELPADLAEVVASAPATYAHFKRKRGTYVVGVITGMRIDGRPGAWEIHNNCTIKPLRQGRRKNHSELPNRAHSGLKYKHNWRFEVTGISSDGGTIFADAINDEGYEITRGQCKAAGAPDVEPGTIVPVSWKLSRRPFYGRIKGARLGYECEVIRFNCSNGYVVGCASSVARTESASAKETTPSLSEEAGLQEKTDWQLQVYPNPVQDWVNLEFSGESQAEPTHVLIYNLSGKLMQQAVVDPKELSYQVDVRELPQGAYLMQVQQGDRRKTLRLLKE